MKGSVMRSSSPQMALPQPMTLTEVVPVIRQLPILDRLRLIRILAEDLETAGDVSPFESGKTYTLPTPYNAFGAAAILAEAMAEYQAKGEE